MFDLKLLLTGMLLVFGAVLYAQEKKTETVTSDGVDNKLSITGTGMYGGTESEKAKEFYLMASDYGNSGDFENAKKFYTKAIKEDPKYVEAYDNLGLVYRQMGELDNAIKQYKKSIMLYPNGITAHQNLAAAYGLKKNINGAVKEYEAILRITPNNAEGYFGLANSYMMMSQFEKALDNGNRALELYKKQGSDHLSDGYYLVGLIHYYMGHKDSAKEYMQIAKEKGAVLHPQMEEEFFSAKSSRKEKHQLDTPEDYAMYEQQVINGFDYLLKSPMNVEPQKRKEVSAFIMKWVTGSPTVTIELSQELVPYMDCPDCLLIFMGGWTKYAIESKKYDDKVGASLAGTESVIEFYLANKKELGRNKSIDKFVKLQREKKLRAFIRNNI